MSACEKCWSDAHHGGDVATNYAHLLEERKTNPCAPEEQAGPGASECPRCKRMTCHQYTGECMVAGCDYWRGRSEG